jgi:hypothetical protein
MLSLIYDGLALTSQRITPGDTATAIGKAIYKYEEKKFHIDSGGSGGTFTLTAGMRIYGVTSTAVGEVIRVGAVEGATTWAGNDAACYIWVKSIVGTFQNNDVLTVDGTADAATIDGIAIALTKDEYVYPEYYGLTARQLWIQGETASLRISINGTLPTQTSKMGMVLANGSSMIITDADNMAKCYVINAANATAGYANVVGLF